MLDKIMAIIMSIIMLIAGLSAVSLIIDQTAKLKKAQEAAKGGDYKPCLDNLVNLTEILAEEAIKDAATKAITFPLNDVK